jgi:CPA1 family monovalent cation:H+ antiporter
MLFNLWDYLSFLANSLVFLLIGLEVDLSQLGANLIPIAVAVAAVLFSRGVVVYGMPLIAHLFQSRPPLPLSWRHVLFWGQLRGAISLALVLGVPVALPERGLLKSMTFGVLLFTLLGQGTTIQFLLDRLGLTQKSPHWLAREKRLGQIFAARAGLRRLESLHREGLLLDEMWDGLRTDYRYEQQRVVKHMTQLFHEHAELEREMLLQARREALQAERGALGDALRRGLISEHVHGELTTDIDYRLEALNLIQAAIVDAETD